ncbi:hypothetical protein [Denitromonas sp.]|uniref:hypothetical protein n=1 Tax=Denitromonas sp. TaxID=2734609 RepID=UPI002AFEED6B|nr:hypothetical protein [Denitromonas sp.]
MFHTYPEAEQPIPKPLATRGERAWHWVELGLNLPYYLLELAVGPEHDSMIRHISTANLDVVTEAFHHAPRNTRLRSVSLLSPDYVNGSKGYQLDRVAEIWSPNPDFPSRLLFVLDDSRSLQFCLSGDEDTDEEMQLLADFKLLAVEIRPSP